MQIISFGVVPWLLTMGCTTLWLVTPLKSTATWAAPLVQRALFPVPTTFSIPISTGEGLSPSTGAHLCLLTAMSMNSVLPFDPSCVRVEQKAGTIVTPLIYSYWCVAIILTSLPAEFLPQQTGLMCTGKNALSTQICPSTDLPPPEPLLNAYIHSVFWKEIRTRALMEEGE